MGVGQQVGGELIRRGVAGGVLGLFIVVAELHQQQIARAQSRLHRSPQALVVKTLGAATIAGMVVHRNAGAHIQVQDLPHAALRPRGNIIELHGGITDPKNTRCHKPKLPLLHYYIYYSARRAPKQAFQPR